MKQLNKTITIDGFEISKESETYIIAEAGVNHNGDMSLAKELIDIAKEAGANAVKFQTFKADDLILKTVNKAPYQKRTTDKSETQYEMLKCLEVSKEQNCELIDYSKKKQITFLSTPFEKNSLEELEELNVPAYKIAATDLTNIQFLRQVAKKHKPIILSAGMCYLEEVEKAVDTISESNQNLILLQCTANYPIQDEEANLRVVTSFIDKFDMIVGYSDHSSGIGASPYAVALGAKVIEKHFTLDKTLKGPDHKASVTPDELKKLVLEIRKVEKYLGDGVKMPTYSEQATRRSLQKCLVADKEIKKGDIITGESIVAKRTDGIGISALYYDNVIGKRAEKNYNKNDIIVL